MKYTYPEDYTDEDKAVYDDLMSRGQALLGKKLSLNDEFLLDLSAKITINNAKGKTNNLSQEEVDEMMKAHTNAQKEIVVTTPENMFEEGNHPMQRPDTRISNVPPIEE